MFTAIARAALMLSAALLLSACGNGSADTAGDGTPVASASPDGTEPRAGLGCSWLAVSPNVWRLAWPRAQTTAVPQA